MIDLGAALREYDLSINHKKAEIAELPLAATEFWEHKLNSIDLTTSFGKTTYTQVRLFLDSAVELMYANKGNSTILNYAIKILAGKDLTDNTQEYTAKTVLSYAFLYPYLIPLLGKYMFDTLRSICQTHSCIKAFSERIYSDGMKIHSYERTAYAMYYAMQYSFPIDSFDVEAVMDSEDCILLLLAFLYCKKRNRKADMKRLKDLAPLLSKDNDSFDSFWLFIYEVLPQNDLHDEWKPVKKAKVSFLKAQETH